jgi:hypothetical protein
MKTTLIAAFLLASLTTMAQFPAPTNLEFEYQYIMIDQGGYCDGHWISGPAYCSHFNWSPPDTSTTEATLDHYNLYYNQYWYPDTTLVLYCSVQDTFFTVENGFMGEMWVTAVYSGPQGESGPSNIIINPDLPISVDQTGLPAKKLLSFDSNLQIVRIDQSDKISSIKLYDSLGKLIKSYEPSLNIISVNQLVHGLYVIEIHDNNNRTEQLKFIR